MTQNISTKICIYGCGLNLYWNTSLVNTEMSLPRRSMFVLIVNNNLNQLYQQQQPQQDQTITINFQNNLNLKCPTH